MKRGFTLIELLAVIVIIAIIATIGFFAITKIMDKSRNDSLKDTALAVKRAVGYYAKTAEEILENPEMSKVETLDQEDETNYKAGLIDLNKDPWGGEYSKAFGIVEKPTLAIDVYLQTSKGCYELEDGADTIQRTGAECGVETPIPPVAEECFAFDGAGTITDYDFNCGSEMPIPETIEGITVTAIADDAFLGEYYNGGWVYEKLTRVSFPNTITAIGARAFYGNSLQKLVLPDSITTIGEDAFRGNDIASLKLPNNITRIENGTFEGNELTTVNIPNSVTYLSGFRWNKITSVDLPDNLITLAKDAFPSNKLSSIVIPGTVTRIEADALCNNNFTELPTIPPSVTYLSGFDDNLFTEIVIPNTVEIIGENAFTWNPNLTSVTIPANVRVIEAEAFGGSIITDVNFIGISQLETIGNNAFSNNQLTSIDIPDGVTSIGLNAFANNLFTSLPDIPSGVTELLGFGYNNFTSLTIPSNITRIGDSAFAYSTFPSLTIPSTVTSIGNYSFMGCTIPDLNLPNTITSIGDYAFYVNSFSSLVIPSSVTSISWYAFGENSNLSSVRIHHPSGYDFGVPVTDIFYPYNTAGIVWD